MMKSPVFGSNSRRNLDPFVLVFWEFFLVLHPRTRAVCVRAGAARDTLPALAAVPLGYLPRTAAGGFDQPLRS